MSHESLTMDPTQQRGGNDLAWHLTFGGLLVISLISFSMWSFDFVGPEANKAILITTIVFGIFMAFNIGGNDVANSFGTSVGAGTLSLKQALVIAAIFEVSGAVIAGGAVTDTVKSGIVDLDAIDLNPNQFAFIMMASLVGASLWLLLATRMGWPVSTTHSIIGGIVGASVVIGAVENIGGLDMVQWDKIGTIAISWVLSPVLGGLASLILFGVVKRYILTYNDKAEDSLREIKDARLKLHDEFKRNFDALTEAEQLEYSRKMSRDAAKLAEGKGVQPSDFESDYYRALHTINERSKNVRTHKALEILVPPLAAFGAIVIAAMLLFKGLDNLNLHISSVGNYMIMGMVGAITWIATYIFAKSLNQHDLPRATFVIFSWMQVFTACAFAFSHGANDIANAIGPFSAVIDVLREDAINAEAAVPMPALVTCGIALIAGLWFVGRHVIKTVGSGITKMHPASGFSAELAAAGVVMGASLLGLPVSSTHILIGAVLGVGIVNRAANWKLMKPIALAWVITLPAAAIVSSISVLVFNAIWG